MKSKDEGWSNVESLVGTLAGPRTDGEDIGAAVGEALRLPDAEFNVLIAKLNDRLEDD